MPLKRGLWIAMLGAVFSLHAQTVDKVVERPVYQNNKHIRQTSSHVGENERVIQITFETSQNAKLGGLSFLQFKICEEIPVLKNGEDLGKRALKCEPLTHENRFYAHTSYDQKRKGLIFEKKTIDLLPYALMVMLPASAHTALLRVPVLAPVYVRTLAAFTKVFRSLFLSHPLFHPAMVPVVHLMTVGGAVGIASFKGGEWIVKVGGELSDSFNSEKKFEKIHDLKFTDPEEIKEMSFDLHVENLDVVIEHIKNIERKTQWKHHPEMCENCYVHCYSQPSFEEASKMQGFNTYARYHIIPDFYNCDKPSVAQLNVQSLVKR